MLFAAVGTKRTSAGCPQPNPLASGSRSISSHVIPGMQSEAATRNDVLVSDALQRHRNVKGEQSGSKQAAVARGEQKDHNDFNAWKGGRVV